MPFKYSVITSSFGTRLEVSQAFHKRSAKCDIQFKLPSVPPKLMHYLSYQHAAWKLGKLWYMFLVRSCQWVCHGPDQDMGSMHHFLDSASSPFGDTRIMAPITLVTS